jgi:hypothetical protein
VADALESGADFLSGIQRCNRFSFAVPLWLLRVWMLDGNLQAERDDRDRVPSLAGLDKRFVKKNGFSFYVDLHIIVNGELPVREGHRISHRAEENSAEF